MADITSVMEVAGVTATNDWDMPAILHHAQVRGQTGALRPAHGRIDQYRLAQ
jgi:hypothetical protein